MGLAEKAEATVKKAKEDADKVMSTAKQARVAAGGTEYKPPPKPKDGSEDAKGGASNGKDASGKPPAKK